jgi:uncharacterized protein (TIGR00661 family)
MRFLFVIQGEGRGHMTQAMAMYQMLTRRGHEVCDVVVGTSDRREIPKFFNQEIQCPIHRIQSPNFVTDSKQKSIQLWATIRQNLQQTSIFYSSLLQLKKLVDERHPDIILNFYDLLAGLYNGLYRPDVHFMTIGHQYLIAHPDFPFAPGSPVSKLLFKLATKLTAWGTKDQIALSFRPYAEEKSMTAIRIWPPLLRTKIKNMVPSKGDFFLTYLVNPGYAVEVKAWAEANPDIHIAAFWDQKDQTAPYQPLPNLCFYPLDETLFLEKMASCKALACTAGFESVCEAMYLGKPVMMVPVAGQYEQACNAVDAVISGAGMTSNFFDFTAFKNFLDQRDETTFAKSTFYQWLDKQDSLVDNWLNSYEIEHDKNVTRWDVYNGEIPQLAPTNRGDL